MPVLASAPPARPRRGWHPTLVVALVVALAVALALAAGCGATATGGDALRAGPVGPTTAATVVRVVDGDTIVVRSRDADREETVRLIGIDTPETKKPDTPVECFGREASTHLQELLPAGAAVRLEADAEPRDRYGRTLAYVHRDDGLFVNLAMVADGFANQLTIPPNVTHEPALRAAVRAARDADAGLWGACPSPHSPAS